jgi:surface protein
MDTSKCIDMNRMFYTCQQITTIPEIDTSNVTNMREMFYTCSNLASIPKMNTSKCTNMYGMFISCKKLKSVTGFDITNVTDFTRMFYRCSELEEVQFTGELKSTATVTNMFQNVTSQGTFYYPANYADSYQKIINILPATWVAIGE